MFWKPRLSCGLCIWIVNVAAFQDPIGKFVGHNKNMSEGRAYACVGKASMSSPTGSDAGTCSNEGNSRRGVYTRGVDKTTLINSSLSIFEHVKRFRVHSKRVLENWSREY